MLKPAAEPESHSSSAHRSRRGDSQPSSSPKLRGCFAFSSRHFESSTNFGLVCAAARSAELCAAHLRAKHLGISWATSPSPAPVETDRRPEDVDRAARFAVATAPILLGEGRPPTACQEIAEGEPIMRKANSGRKLGVSAWR
jgi:hypothetical protein